MRKSIRLTGRRQLPQTAFAVQLTDVAGKRVATLALRDPQQLKTFAPDAELRVKLAENKLVEVLRFGTIARPVTSAQLSEQSFRAPSCQVRVVCGNGATTGMLLGSTNPWTLKTGNEPDGILLFQPADIKLLLWKLDLRESGDEQPILYVDESIPDAAIWAKSDPIFAACVLPTVVAEIMRKILQLASAPEDGWEADWLTWAAALMPGSKPPFAADMAERELWIRELIETFAHRHDFAGQALAALAREGILS